MTEIAKYSNPYVRNPNQRWLEMIHAKYNNVILSSWPILLPFFVFVLHSLLFRSWLIDDAGISFAYARNFIHGCGLVSQPGVEPVEGFSNPLWTFLISPLFITDPVDPALPIKLISLGLICGTFALVGRINRFLFGHSWWSRFTTAATLLFISINTSFVVWTTSGLENPLYAFLCALYSLQLIMYATDADRRSATLAAYAGLSAAGLALTRPDGLIFLVAFPGMLVIRAVNDLSEWKTEGRRFAVFLITALLPITAYISFRIAYFGDPYPNTYYAKGGPSLQDMAKLVFLTKDPLEDTYNLFHSMFSWRAGIFLTLLLLGVSHLVLERWKTSPVIFLLPILACSWAIYCLLPPDWMDEFRFGTLFFLTLPLVLFALLTDTLAISPLSSHTRKVVFLTAATLVIAHSALVYAPRSLQFAESPTVPFKGVAQRFGIRFNFYANELGISEASFLAPDLGGTLYFSRLRVYDLAGLCNRKIARLISKDHFRDIDEDDTIPLRDYVFNNLHPTFIHVHGGWSIRSGFFSDHRFQELYATIQETPSEWAEEQGYSGIYSGDYVLKAAISSYNDLRRLRQKLYENTSQVHVFGEEKAVPFPRG